MKISHDFSLEEFITSKVALLRNIDNTPTVEAIENINFLVKKLLQPLRTLYGRPLSINSGFRSQLLNRAVGGVGNSAHLKGLAADVACNNPQKLLEKLKISGLTFDQAILYPTFLHLSLKRGLNRGQIIIK